MTPIARLFYVEGLVFLLRQFVLCQLTLQGSKTYDAIRIVDDEFAIASLNPQVACRVGKDLGKAFYLLRIHDTRPLVGLTNACIDVLQDSGLTCEVLRIPDIEFLLVVVGLSDDVILTNCSDMHEFHVLAGQRIGLLPGNLVGTRLQHLFAKACIEHGVSGVIDDVSSLATATVANFLDVVFVDILKVAFVH